MAGSMDILRVKDLLKKTYYERIFRQRKSSSEYWSVHNVTSSRRFSSASDSLAYFEWRNDQYFNYIDLMPVDRQDGKMVLDYGCGPGNDLVGFLHFSRPSKLVGCDVSERSLEEARLRIRLHEGGDEVQLVKLEEADENLPFDDYCFDYIHCSGVLHHTPDPERILREFKRVLRPDGRIRVMVYNYDSVWLHLYVAYQQVVLRSRYSQLSIREAFSKFTDGEACPISKVYRPSEFEDMARRSDLSCRLIGSSVSQHEMSLLPLRYEAMQNPALREESRKFLMQLTFDERQLPKYQGIHAGIGAEFEMNP